MPVDYLGASFVHRQYKRYERTIGTYFWCTKLLAVSGTTSDEVSTIDFVFGKEKQGLSDSILAENSENALITPVKVCLRRRYIPLVLQFFSNAILLYCSVL